MVEGEEIIDRNERVTKGDKERWPKAESTRLPVDTGSGLSTMQHHTTIVRAISWRTTVYPNPPASLSAQSSLKSQHSSAYLMLRIQQPSFSMRHTSRSQLIFFAR